MGVVVIPAKPKKTVVIDSATYAAMQRLEDQQGIPLAVQLRVGMRKYLNSYAIHITKERT